MANKATNINGSGAPTDYLSWTAWPNLRCTLSLPVGVLAANGNRPIWVTAVRMYAGGNGGGQSLRAKVGGSFSSTIGIASGDGRNLTANMGINAMFANGGATTLQLDQYDALYFGANPASNTISSDGGVEKSGKTLTGAIEYVTVPSAPTGLHVTDFDGTSVSLGWGGPSDTGGNYGYTEIRYNVLRSTSSNMAGAVVIATTGYGVGAYTATGLVSGTRYYFAVVARQAVTDQFGTTSVNSNIVNATPSTTPGAPTSVAATVSGTSATVTFAAPSDGGSPISAYSVLYGTSPTLAGASSAGASGSPKVISGLTLGDTYYFAVTATNANGTGPRSAIVSATVDAAPAAPTGVAVALARGSAWLTWNAPPGNGGSPLIDYTVSYGTSSTLAGADTVVTPDRAINLPDLAPGVKYYFAVTARNIVGLGTRSAIINDTVQTRTTMDSVAQAAVHVSGGYQVELRSDGAATPAITLGYMPLGSTDWTAIATVPTAAGGWRAPLTLEGLALVADPAGNLYVIGGSVNDPNAILVRRYLRSGPTAWAASGVLSQALPSTGQPLVSFAAAYVPGTGTGARPSILVVARRAGSMSTGSIGAAVLNLANLASSSGALFLYFWNDPTWLSAPPTADYPNAGVVDMTPLVAGGTRIVVMANHDAIVDVINGVVSSISKQAAGAQFRPVRSRILGVDASTFALVYDSPGSNLRCSFYSLTLSALGSVEIDVALAYGGDFADRFDAYFNAQSGQIRVYFNTVNSGRAANRADVSPVTYSAAIDATNLVMASGGTLAAFRVPHGAVDERSVSVTAPSTVTALGIYNDVTGNLAPTAPVTVDEQGFDASTARTFKWAFGDPNAADVQTAYQFQIQRVSDSVNVVDSGKVVSSAASYALADHVLTNGVDYRWRVLTYDVLDVVGAWSAYDTFTTSALGTLTITDPATDNPPGVEVSSYTVTWDYEQADGYVQTKRRVRVIRVDDSSVISDTTMQASTDVGYTVTGLPSDVELTIEVSVVTNAPGTPTVLTTRLLTTSYALPMVPEVILATVEPYVSVTVVNPDPTGSHPEVDHNDIERRLTGSTDDFVRIATVGPDGTFNDYGVASGASYDYRVLGVANLGQVYSDEYSIVAASLLGSWWLDPDDPEGTVIQFIHAGARALTTTLSSGSFHFFGRELPVREFGEFTDKALAVEVTVPMDDNYIAGVAWLRAFADRRGVALYRDNRGRKMYVTVDGDVGEADAIGSSVFSMTLTQNDYSEAI